MVSFVMEVRRETSGLNLDSFRKSSKLPIGTLICYISFVNGHTNEYKNKLTFYRKLYALLFLMFPLKAIKHTCLYCFTKIISWLVSASGLVQLGQPCTLLKLSFTLAKYSGEFLMFPSPLPTVSKVKYKNRAGWKR